ncbi:MAG: DUF2931 family protein [Paludibacteraceae bacterium]|nr:DUF2931 family protein [Paludibacteraceae bacterium]
MIKKLCQLWLLFLSLVASCSNKKELQKNKDNSQMEDERFYYEVCCSGPKLGPGDYVTVEYIGESGTVRVFGNESIGVGMGLGHDGVTRSRASRFGLPKAIEATWVSWTDRKVYSVATLLPYDTILSLFRDGGEPCVPAPKGTTPDNLIGKTIDCFDLCFLPGGKVMLYVNTAVKSILLDWSAEGVEETDDEILSDIYMQYGLDNMDEYYDMFYSDKYKDYEPWRKYMRKHGTIAPLLERYMERFNYTLNFEFENKETVIDYVLAKYTNGEHQSGTSKFNDCFSMPSRLKDIRVVWDTKDYHYTCFMYFNEEEMLKVFDEAYGNDRTQKGELTIKVCKYNNLFDIFLNVGGKSIKLEKTEIRAFRDPIDDPHGDGTLIYKNYEGNHKNLFADDKGYVKD